MPHTEFIWIEGSPGNIAHLREHDVTPEEAEAVVQHPISTDISRTTRRPIAFGYTDAGRKLAVVYERIDHATVDCITAYDVE